MWLAPSRAVSKSSLPTLMITVVGGVLKNSQESKQGVWRRERALNRRFNIGLASLA